MCLGCWQEAGSPKIVTDNIKRAAELISKLYEMPDGGVGGNLHIVTDDWNLDKGCLRFCRKQVLAKAKHPPADGYSAAPDQLKLETEILDLLEGMPIKERYSTLALVAGAFVAA